MNEDLARLGLRARLTFIGLWTLADKQGRLEDRPDRIRAELFPYERVKLDSVLEELEIGGFIIRYVGEMTQRLIQIANFAKHQHPHHREPESVTKPPSSDISCTSPGQAVLSPSVTSNRNTEYGIRFEDKREHVGKNADALALLEIWNIAARENGWRQCRTLTAERHKKAKSRLHEHDLDWWKQIFTRAGPSAFLREAAWFTLDWLLKNETNAVKVLEGNYDDKQAGNNGAAERKRKHKGTFIDRTTESIARERGLDKP